MVKSVSRKHLQLVGVTAMLVASKYEEIWAPEVRDFVYISDRAYNRDQILNMEKIDLPVFALVPGEGVRVILSKEPDGKWKSEGRKGIHTNKKFPEGTRFASVKLERKPGKKRSAKEMFKEIAFRHKTALLHAGIASLSINILALATSFFSMQVYDRVIPTQGVSTLIALGIGVFVAIFLEMLLKLSRSYLLDGAAAHMDVSYSHDIFNRFLKIRPDALPRSVGTLSGQLQSYATVRSFISSAALYVLIDFPFSMINLMMKPKNGLFSGTTL